MAWTIPLMMPLILPPRQLEQQGVCIRRGHSETPSTNPTSKHQLPLVSQPLHLQRIHQPLACTDEGHLDPVVFQPGQERKMIPTPYPEGPFPLQPPRPPLPEQLKLPLGNWLRTHILAQERAQRQHTPTTRTPEREFEPKANINTKTSATTNPPFFVGGPQVDQNVLAWCSYICFMFFL